MGDAVIIDDQASNSPLNLRSKYPLEGVAKFYKRARVDMKPVFVVVFDSFDGTKELYRVKVQAGSPVTFSFATEIEHVLGLAIYGGPLVLRTSSVFDTVNDTSPYYYRVEYAGPIKNVSINGVAVPGGKRLVVEE